MILKYFIDPSVLVERLTFRIVISLDKIHIQKPPPGLIVQI